MKYVKSLQAGKNCNKNCSVELLQIIKDDTCNDDNNNSRKICVTSDANYSGTIGEINDSSINQHSSHQSLTLLDKELQNNSEILMEHQSNSDINILPAISSCKQNCSSLDQLCNCRTATDLKQSLEIQLNGENGSLDRVRK
jgi:hypothetical protein